LNEADHDRVAQALRYRFADPQLIETALSHPSFSHEWDGSRGNERLEFLGDAVLDLVVAEILYRVHPEWNEGDLTRTRAGLVNQRALAARARALGLPDWIRLGRTEQQSGGSGKDSILANCVEALIGALYLDGGLPAVTDFIQREFADGLQRDAKRQARDPKTELQEWAHAKRSITPRYQTIGDSGTDNDECRFTVEVTIGDDVWGRGVGRTKRAAEREAALAALDRCADAAGPEALDV